MMMLGVLTRLVPLLNGDAGEHILSKLLVPVLDAVELKLLAVDGSGHIGGAAGHEQRSEKGLDLHSAKESKVCKSDMRDDLLVMVLL